MDRLRIRSRASLLLDGRSVLTRGAIHCPYYMKTGTCKFGATCKFDHPPPGEVMAAATSLQTSSPAAAGEEEKEGKEDGDD
ncbi:zinc finger CCCH domain-containing protein [Castilleja foliolosa]|uniref:Zinc finger CCCH domain-containing protein n=1 Tax=Castilleja foliolosa TaxID=1961234 RepID=A0ABD3CCB5_9LAMI